MKDHELVRAAMRAADPAPTTDREAPAEASVVRLAADHEDGVLEESRPSGRRWIAAMAAAAVVITAVVSIAIVSNPGASDEPPPGTAPSASTADSWCDRQPLVVEPSSGSPSALRVYYTAQLAHALTSLQLAPPAIVDESGIVLAETRRIHDELEAADWDGGGIDRTLSPEARTAQAAIDQYRSRTCP